MTRVPPELDSLMWAIAEQGNPGAADEFVRRYPIYREELMRRQQTVSGLRSSKPPGSNPVHGTPPRIPKFSPREVRRMAPAPPQVALVSILALAAIAAAAFTATKMLSPRPVTIQVAIPTVQTGPLRLPNPPVQFSPAPPPPVNGGGTGAPPPPETSAPKSERLQTLVVKRAGLREVLGLVGAQSGLSITLAPGMPNPVVAVEYRDMTAMAILRDLGTRYRFTPFDQGDGSVIVYPAVDPRENPATAPGDVRQATN